MDLVELVTLEIGLIGLVGALVGFMARTMARRFDKIDRSVAKLHDRIDNLKDAGHAEHVQIAERLARMETRLELTDD